MWNFLVYILLIACFFYLFVCVSPHGKGPLSKIRNFLFVCLPDFLRSSGTKICGRHFVSLIDRMISYVCFETNPIVQVLYIVLAGGGFFVYVHVGFNKYIPNKYVPEYHKYIGTAIMGLCYLSFLLASWTSPGIVTKQNLKACVKKFPFDNVMFVKG